jgi:hypothetical protein
VILVQQARQDRRAKQVRKVFRAILVLLDRLAKRDHKARLEQQDLKVKQALLDQLVQQALLDPQALLLQHHQLPTTPKHKLFHYQPQLLQ